MILQSTSTSGVIKLIIRASTMAIVVDRLTGMLHLLVRVMVVRAPVIHNTVQLLLMQVVARHEQTCSARRHYLVIWRLVAGLVNMMVVESDLLLLVIGVCIALTLSLIILTMMVVSVLRLIHETHCCRS